MAIFPAGSTTCTARASFLGLHALSARVRGPRRPLTLPPGPHPPQERGVAHVQERKKMENAHRKFSAHALPVGLGQGCRLRYGSPSESRVMGCQAAAMNSGSREIPSGWFRRTRGRGPCAIRRQIRAVGVHGAGGSQDCIKRGESGRATELDSAGGLCGYSSMIRLRSFWRLPWRRIDPSPALCRASMSPADQRVAPSGE